MPPTMPGSPTPPEPDPQLTVALFTDNYGPGHSGLLYAVQFLEEELLKSGHRVLLVAPEANGKNPFAGHPNRREIRLPSVVIPGVPARVAMGQDFEFRLAQLAANPPDVIHVHGLGPIGLLGVWAAKRTGKPLMVTWHTDFEAYADHYWHLTPFLDAAYQLIKVRVDRPTWPEFKQLRMKKPRRWSSRRNLLKLAASMLEDADLVTTPSNKTADRVLELAPRARVRVIPNGADALPEGPPLPRGKDARLIYVGRIAPEKGISLMLDAFELVRQTRPRIELVIVGEWRKVPSLRTKLVRARRRGGVRLLGQVPRDRLEPYYASGDIFVFPSQTDTQALVLHEAAHAGLPIVTVDPHLRLVIDPGVNAMVARPNPPALAHAILSLLRQLEDPEFRQRAQQRSRELAARWSIQNQSEEMIGIYEDLAAGRPVETRTHVG